MGVAGSNPHPEDLCVRMASQELEGIVTSADVLWAMGEYPRPKIDLAINALARMQRIAFL